MNKNVIRIIAVIPGLGMLLNGLGFIFRPADVAASLHMDLLEGLGRSTQIGDLTSFFIGTAVLIFLGVIFSKGRWLYAGALFVFGAAIFRSLAALTHGAAWATDLIILETVIGLWLCICAYLMDKPQT